MLPKDLLNSSTGMFCQYLLVVAITPADTPGHILGFGKIGFFFFLQNERTYDTERFIINNLFNIT